MCTTMPNFIKRLTLLLSLFTFFLDFFEILFYVYECFACMHVYHVHVECSWRSEQGIGFPGTAVIDDCEAPCGRWELNLGLLQEQMLLTTEPSLKPRSFLILNSRLPLHSCLTVPSQ